MGYFYQMFTFTFPPFYVKLDVTMKKLSNLFGNGIKNTLTSFAAALAVVAGTAGLSQKANAAPSFSTLRYIRTDDTRSMPSSFLSIDTWKTWCWADGLGNKFTLAFDTTSINAPVTSATQAFAKLELDGQVYTSGGIASTYIAKPTGGVDTAFSGLFTPVNGGAEINWAVIPGTTWTDMSIQGFIDALSSPGATVYAAPDQEASKIFTTNNNPSILASMPEDIIPSPASSLVLGTGVAAAALRRRRTAMEMAH